MAASEGFIYTGVNLNSVFTKIHKSFECVVSVVILCSRREKKASESNEGLS